MSNLQQRQEKIQEKRKQTSFRDFVRDVCSWLPLSFNKWYGVFSRYPQTDRIAWVVANEERETYSQVDEEYRWNFVQSLSGLMGKSHFPPLLHRGDNENVAYADIILNAKNVYLSIAVVGDSENVLYSRSVKHNCHNVISSIMVRNGSENIFESSAIVNSSAIFYSHTIQDSHAIWFCQDMIGCQECILCSRLQNTSYCIRNKQYSPQEYIIEKNSILQNKSRFDDYANELDFVKSNQWSEWCTGQNILNSRNVSHGYYSNNVFVAHNVILFWSTSTSEYIYDAITGWSPLGTHIYGWVSNSGEHIYCGSHCEDCAYVYYSYDIENCSFCLWCIGLKNKSYYILNKQYTKEEWYAKVDEIFLQMERGWQLWGFFPATMNPFYFNDTAAYLIDNSFTKEEVTKLWYLRRDEPIKVDIPEWAVIVKSSELWQFESVNEQWNWKLDETVCKRVIIDENGDAYRIIPMELEFLQKHGLPLPRKHWLTRMKENFRIG